MRLRRPLFCGKAPSASSNVPSSLDPHECFYSLTGAFSSFMVSFPFSIREGDPASPSLSTPISVLPGGGVLSQVSCFIWAACNLPRAQPVQRAIFFWSSEVGP